MRFVARVGARGVLVAGALATGGCAEQQLVWVKPNATAAATQADLTECERWAGVRAQAEAENAGRMAAMYGDRSARALQFDAYERYLSNYRRRCMIDLGYQGYLVTGKADKPPAQGASPAPAAAPPASKLGTE